MLPQDTFGCPFGRERTNMDSGIFHKIPRMEAARAACVAKLVHAPGCTYRPNDKPTRNNPACAARVAMGNDLRPDEDRAYEHPADYLCWVARRFGVVTSVYYVVFLVESVVLVV